MFAWECVRALADATLRRSTGEERETGHKTPPRARARSLNDTHQINPLQQSRIVDPLTTKLPCLENGAVPSPFRRNNPTGARTLTSLHTLANDRDAPTTPSPACTTLLCQRARHQLARASPSGNWRRAKKRQGTPRLGAQDGKGELNSRCRLTLDAPARARALSSR